MKWEIEKIEIEPGWVDVTCAALDPEFFTNNFTFLLTTEQYERLGKPLPREVLIVTMEVCGSNQKVMEK